MLPLASLPVDTARVVWFAASQAALLGSFWLMLRVLGGGTAALAAVAAVWIVGGTVQENLVLGQVNPFLLLAIALALWLLPARPRTAAAVIGVAAALKVWPALLLLGVHLAALVASAAGGCGGDRGVGRRAGRDHCLPGRAAGRARRRSTAARRDRGAAQRIAARARAAHRRSTARRRDAGELDRGHVTRRVRALEPARLDRCGGGRAGPARERARALDAACHRSDGRQAPRIDRSAATGCRSRSRSARWSPPPSSPRRWVGTTISSASSRRSRS